MHENLTLYHMGFSRSTSVLWMLEEVGRPYSICPVSSIREKRDSSYLEINPLNKVPALKHNGKIITEAAAIILYLAEVFPQANLDIRSGDPRRADYLKWSFLAASCIGPGILDIIFERPKIPASSAGWGDFNELITHISHELSKKEFILGDQFTSADIILASQLGWGVMIDKFPKTSEITDYLRRLGQRPARKRILEMEEMRQWPK